MIKWLMVLTLTCSVSFIGFQMHENDATKSLIEKNANNYLTKFNKTAWMAHFDCFYNAMAYILMLTPLVAVAPQFRIAALLSSGAIKIVGMLMYLDLGDLKGSLMNEELLKMLVVSAGLFGLFCRIGRRWKMMKMRMKQKTA